MNEVVDFLKSNRDWIIAVALFILELLVLILKKRPKTLDNFCALINEAAALVPSWCSDVERPGEGSNKKLQVMICARNFVTKHLGRQLDQKEIDMLDQVMSAQIENVLSCPTKKEVL